MSDVGRAGAQEDSAARSAAMWDGGKGSRRRRGGRREGGEQPTVPEAEFRTYYDVPVVKAPPWNWSIPTYLFTGGLAGGSTLLALGGELTDAPALRRVGRVTALAATVASGGLLVYDLGRPERFYMMLRVARPTSPMSMGTWILTAYGPMAGLAAAAEAAPLLPKRGRLGALRRMPTGSTRGINTCLGRSSLSAHTGCTGASCTSSWAGSREEAYSSPHCSTCYAVRVIDTCRVSVI